METKDKKRLNDLEEAIKKISEMPIVRGCGELHIRYNGVINIAKEIVNKNE